METTQDRLDLRVLEYIYANSSDGQAAETLGLEEGVGYEALQTTLVALTERGVIRPDGRMDPDYVLTADGRVAVEAMLQRRSDRGLRRRLCRNLLLRWIDNQGGGHVPRAQFDYSADLLPFTEGESEAAADFLSEHGLIKSLSAYDRHVVVWTTDLGRECIDEGGDVAAFTRRQAGTPPGGQVFNIYGSGNSVAAAVGDDNEVIVSLSTFDHDRAIEFASAVRDAVPALTPHGIDAAQVERYAAEIEQRQDLTRAQKATALLHRMMESTTTGTLGGVLATLGAGALGIA